MKKRILVALSILVPAALLVAAHLITIGPESEAERFHRIFAAIEQAEKIKDPVQRCLAYPDLSGSHWPKAAISAFCADELTPSLMWPEFRSKIESGQGKELDARLDQLLDGYFSGSIPEGTLRYAYYGNFSGTSAEVKRLIDHWLTQSPDSAHAQIARGIYQVEHAAQVRGGKFISDTPRADVEQMSAELAVAVQDIKRGLAKNPRILPGYIALIDAARMDGDGQLGNEALQQVLAIDPANFYVRSAYAFLAEPRWGGSLALLDQIADEASPWLNKNPRLINLRAIALGYRGWPDYRTKKYAQALQKFELALAEGPVYIYLNMAGYAASTINQNIRSVELYSQMLRFSPNDIHPRNQRGFALSKLGYDDLALADFDAVLNQVPGNVSTLRQYAHILLKREDYAAAASRLKTLHDIDTSDAWARSTLAWIYLYRLDRLDEADTLIKKMLAANAEDGAAWLFRIDLIQKSGSLDVGDAARAFVKYADKNDPRQRHALPEVQAWLKEHPDA